MAAVRAMENLSSEEGSLLAAEEAGEFVAARGMSRWRLPLLAVGALAAVGAVTAAVSAAPREAAALSPMELQGKSQSYAASMSCYSFTGGTCGLKECNKTRGATCIDGNCVCEGACAGADGVCKPGQTNTLVSSEFTLTNVNWPKYSMFFQSTSVMGQMKTSKMPSLMLYGKNEFSLYRLPGPDKEKAFMLGSMKYPSRVARIGATVGTSISSSGLYATELQKGKGPEVLAVSVCYDAKKGALMFGNKAGSSWAYLKTGSWFVYGYKGGKCSTGDGGLWTAKPPFTADQIAELPACGC